MRRSFMKISCLIVCLLVFTACTKQEEDGLTEVSEIGAEVSGEEAESADKTGDEEGSSGQGNEQKDDWIYVHVCGQVQNPGVYPLVSGSRLFEAVAQAGGFTEEAQEASVNLAEVLEDGQQIYIPSEEEAEAIREQEQEAADGKVNLNTASREELMTLSGIGESKADAIIQYREEQGGFRSIEELMEIPGIKEGVFQKVKDKIKIE